MLLGVGMSGMTDAEVVAMVKRRGNRDSIIPSMKVEVTPRVFLILKIKTYQKSQVKPNMIFLLSLLIFRSSSRLLQHSD